jgi:hypothetical protein
MRSTRGRSLVRHTRAGATGFRPTRRRMLLRWGGALSSVGVAGALVGITPAAAVTGYHVTVGSLGLNAHNGPGTGYGVVGTLVNGQGIDIACQTKGTLVGTGLPGTPTDVWDQLTNGWYITDYYTSTPGLGGSYTPGIAQCGVAAPPPGPVPPAPVPPASAPPAPIYQRRVAAAWAVHNYNLNPNSSPYFKTGSDGTDCTNFVSQALWIGGLKRTLDWTDKSPDKSVDSWKNGGTVAEVKADAFKNYIVNTGLATIKRISWSDNTAGGAQWGDIIAYDWEKGSGIQRRNGADGFIDHLAIVTGFHNQTNPLVTQHSGSRLNRYWSWDPNAKNGKGDWIENSYRASGKDEQPRVYLIHIIK